MPIFFFLFAILLTLPVLWPQVDLLVSGWFYRAGQGFYLADNVVFVALHWLAYDGARVLGMGFAMLALATLKGRRKIGGVDSKAWLFLLAALLVGPVLIANVALKDHWGRARPREVTEFGGAASFSPALAPHFENAHSNGSFPSGDGAFGFFLPALAYVAPHRSARRIFWAAMAAGGLFGCARIAMGAHFFSDVVFAAALMLAASAGVHAVFYGRRETIAAWRGWFSRSSAV